jgi:uncharacterized membrane protein
MPIDLSSFDISLLGWLLIGAAAVVLVAAVMRLLGHVLHLVIKGCGFVLLGVIVLYGLRLLGVI